MKSISTQEKVERIRSLTPHDLTAWEQDFRNTIERMALAERIGDLSDKQLDIVDRIYEKHFLR
jgi:hypothetical protein